jgi:hypothetical protein
MFSFEGVLGLSAIRRIALAGLLGLAMNQLEAAPINPNNILVSVRRSVREFTPAGSLVQTIPFNYGGRDYPGNPPVEGVRDIVVDQYGWIDSFNGYWNPFMTRYSPVSNAFTHKTFPGWSTINGGTGGIAAYQKFVFATDKNTSPGTANGIVRFDVFNNSVARFATGIDFNDLNIGLNGKLYALSSSSADIYVYEPVTMQLLNHIVKPANVDWINSIAVDQTGRLFVVGRNGTVYVLDTSGALQASRATGLTGLIDVDIDEAGRLILAQMGGNVLVGDTALLSDFTSFSVGDNSSEIFVCFAHAVPPVGRGAVATPTPTPVPAATPLPAHNILVSLGHGIAGSGISRENSLREFSPDGSLLRSIRFNYNGGLYPITESLRDIVVDRTGVINAFNGTFTPFLTRFSWACSSFTHASFPGWSLVNNSTNGGIAAYQNFIFATDMSTSGSEASGIVRFDTSTNASARFLNATQFTSLTMGLDGKLYAEPFFGGIDVYDPITMQLIKHLNVPSEVEGRGKIAVDQAGTIFMINNYGTVSRLDNNAVLQASSATGFPHLTDIDIDETGRIILGQDEGWIIVADSSLNSFSWFRAIEDPNMSNWMLSVAFSPLAPAPSVQLTRVVSQKLQGKAGPFDIDLPVDGPRGVECRSGGRTGDYSMIFTFAHDLLRVGGVCCDSGIVSGAAIDPSDPRRYIVNLTGVANASYVRVTLNGLDGANGTFSETVSQEMGILVGDIDGNGTVTTGDIIQANSRFDRPVTIDNFREDVTADGVINRNDVILLNSRLGTTVPSHP